MQYGKTYFDYQKDIGAFGGRANLFKFAPFIQPTDTVLDFGCGGGYLLHHIDAASKAGIEINPAARETARQSGLTIYASTAEVPDETADIIVSNHALEHVEAPLDELRALLPKLRPGGKIVFVVPHQKPAEAYRANDPNQHLYTWNPLTLGNLFHAAGYEHIDVDVLRYAWKPSFGRYYRLGQWAFDLRCRVCALRLGNYQIRAVAERSR
jgi:SAM-dependent methyltransferase